MFETWEGTWIYDAVQGLLGLGPALLVAGTVAGLVVASVVFSVRYIARGGGQYGIIEGYVGTIGAGKTTLAVQHALALAKARDAVLLSNIPVKCGKSCGIVEKPDGTFERGCVIEHGTLPMNDDGLDLGALMRRAFKLRNESRGLVLLLDEVGVIMPARLWRDFPVGLMWTLQQSRKLACEWIWTAQDVSFVDHQMRSLTAVVHHVKGTPPPSVWRRAKGKRPWFLVASAYSPSMAPRANNEQSARAAEKRIGRRVVRYRRAWEASFDTDGVVLPSKHLKGADVLIGAAAATGDAHVIDARGSAWGEGMGGALDPDALEGVTG